MYQFGFEEFEKVIVVLKYINFEFELFIENRSEREALKSNLKELKKISKKISDVRTKTIKNPLLKKLRNDSKNFLEKYNYIEDLEIFSEILEKLKLISKIDFRNKKSIDEMYTIMSELCVVID